jgi:hypothetical protein
VTAVGIEGDQVDGKNVVAVRNAVAEALARARAGGDARMIDPPTCRLCDYTIVGDASRSRSVAGGTASPGGGRGGAMSTTEFTLVQALNAVLVRVME